MRRLLLAFALTLIAAAALGTVAFAKNGGVELSSTPFGIKPGDPWTGTLTVFSADGAVAADKPTITIRNLGNGKTQTFDTRPAKVPTTAHSSSFVFEVVFPEAGRYRYFVRDGVTDRDYNFPIVRIAPADAAIGKPGKGASDDSFPVWPLVAGLGGATLLAGAGLLALRGRRRFGLSH